MSVDLKPPEKRHDEVQVAALVGALGALAGVVGALHAGPDWRAALWALVAAVAFGWIVLERRARR